MIIGRENRIINSLIAVCIVAGFACFALIILPDQLGKARAMPAEHSFKPGPETLAAIVPLGPSPRPRSTIAIEGKSDANAPAPSPQGYFASPDGGASPTGGSPGPVRDEDRFNREAGVAGGAGAAIDDDGAEARQAYAVNGIMPTDDAQSASERPAGNTPALKAGLPPKPSDDENRSAIPPGSSIETQAFPLSSLARHEPSLLDSERSRGAKSWIFTPQGLEADVAFWRNIYTKYDKNNVVLHHPRYLGIVYAVVDLSDIDNDPRLQDIEKKHLKESRVNERRDAVTATLKKLATDPPESSLAAGELRIKKLFRGVSESDMFKRAADEDGVRAQTGQRDKFITGLKYSGRYLGEIEKIFESYSLPRELTRLIFVESMFNLRARSSVGASGIWQFMPDTGRLYMSVNDIFDERNDPIAATHAAARLLRHDYEALGVWPLAVNAYNTGRGRMQQAAARVGSSDIGRIVRNFSHPAYGFASRNFFLEYLAALDAAEHWERYFGKIDFDPPLRCEVVRSGYHISLPDVARVSGLSLDELLDLNPALGPSVAAGAKLIPTGYPIRIPEKKGELFLAATARAPRSRTGAVTHLVQDGETLASIAKMYGITPRDIVKSNDGMSWQVRPGQTISVPSANR